MLWYRFWRTGSMSSVEESARAMCIMSEVVVARRAVGLYFGGYAVREEIGGELLDVGCLAEADGLAVARELDSEEIRQIALVFHLPPLG